MKAAGSLLFTVAIMGALTLAVTAQQPQPAPSPGSRVTILSGPDGYREAAGWYQHANAQHQAADLARQYIKAEKESEKKEIRRKLTDTLNELFDEHIQQQQKELEELDKQIAELRAVLKKRASAKTTIVDRRIEQLIQDADGLGWTAPGAPHAGFGQSFGFGGPKVSGKKAADPNKQ
jgi:molecular chaperone DnaK (HSP70)